MLNKLFGRRKTIQPDEPQLNFGRYSDNNKPVSKINHWKDADSLFREGKFAESLDAFFNYLRDDEVENVKFTRNGNSGNFEISQGSKIAKGSFDNKSIKAEITLAKMPQPSVPVMRRLLEHNFNLYYTRYALDGNRLCMRFDSEVAGATPSKLYYGLRELAIRGDKQDDLLVLDFATLQKTDHDHVIPMPDSEKEVRETFMRKWLGETLELVNSLDAAKFCGGISYLLLTCILRIDYLICPEGKLLSEFEKVLAIYFKNDERTVVDKNRDMIDALQKILAKNKSEIYQDLFRSKYTFAIVAPTTFQTVVDSINGALQNMPWYRENNYPHIANRVIEYGISYCQYSYSLPRPVSDLFLVFMKVNHSEYFKAMGSREWYYNPAKSDFNTKAIGYKIQDITEEWKDKYPKIQFRTEALRFDNLVNFNHSFVNEISLLNLEG